ncbi:hypothetical protein BJV78DRAFT_1192756 [Lactifluus subvellereus]|nr:hypothetical protein BJV78DRAFT_1192756 [Lactifluus subvellereus]
MFFLWGLSQATARLHWGSRAAEISTREYLSHDSLGAIRELYPKNCRPNAEHQRQIPMLLDMQQYVVYDCPPFTGRRSLRRRSAWTRQRGTPSVVTNLTKHNATHESAQLH